MDNFRPMDTSCEPMDIDLSTNSANLSSIDREEQFAQPPSAATPLKKESEQEVWNIKKYHIVRDKTSHTRNNTTLYLVGLLMLMISLIMYCLSGIRCCNDLDLKELKFKLHRRLYGQPEVIEDLVKSLNHDATSKILLLYGGTGVGKTFTISLALENFWNSSNVYHYTMPSFVNNFSTDTMLGLNICDSSLVVVDDLKQEDIHIKKKVADVIKKSQNLNKNITVILMYNCDVITGNFIKRCDETFYLKLKSEFNDIDAYKAFINFKPLTQEVLKMCIEEELRGKRRVNDVEFNNILNNFDVTLDGCKGVYKKIKFLNVL